MPKLTIDGNEIEVPAGLTLLQACELAGIEVPRFCYHERLAIAGNCRMCLVGMQGSPKPIASCAMPAADGMVVQTNTPKVLAARKGVMEFLLINHPLDCPICDQGGECDLQDQALYYGFDRGRFAENKRAVQDKNFGPLIKTIMTRCIHCTRCIRFATEVAGVPELGATGRGETMEVGTYVEKALSSELSGNIIDLCPVGALTSKPYAFVARPWELTKTESVDVMDAVGCNIRIDARGAEVLRVLPRLNESVNEEWISDKTRFACDGLRRQRLDRPYLRENGKLRPASWSEAFDAIAHRLKGVAGERIAAIAGDLACAESMLLLKSLMGALGSPHIDCRQDGAKLSGGTRAGYLFNTTIGGIDAADACLLIGTNPRTEAAVLNARLRKRWRAGEFPVAVVGPKADLTYDFEHLGDHPWVLESLATGEHPFANVLREAQRPMLILGMGALTRPDGEALLGVARRIAEATGMIGGPRGWNGFNVLHSAAARVGGLDLGFVPGAGGRDVAGILAGAEAGELEVVYLLGADEIDTARLGKAFVIYQGHHGDAGAHRADVILPGAAYTEKDATYVNTEGRAQRAWFACLPPGEAKEDWAIVRALSASLGKTLPANSLADVRQLLAAAGPAFAAIDQVVAAEWGPFGGSGGIDDAPLLPTIDTFYLTNAICRASATMARCVEAFGADSKMKTGTHG
ncbi:MAG: NADH-quinone oxidoreductase subunit G [Rhodospirillales bacterium]|nr:NADH-quinone oxidoreductase subunit G [Rhodospirillales bacterium]